MKILILKIIILVELLLFLGLFIFFPQYDCDNCKFEIDGKKVSTEKLVDLYFEQCIRADRRSSNYVFERGSYRIAISNESRGSINDTDGSQDD